MIGIQRQDQGGAVEAQFADPEILDLLLDNATADTKCLQFIDPYGDTTFNRHQASVLAGVLEEAAAKLADRPARDRAAVLVAFVRDVAAQIHTYVKFVGD
jgi:hypothetical protein